MSWYHLGNIKYGVSTQCLDDQTWESCADAIAAGFRPVWLLMVFQIFELLFTVVYALDLWFLFRVSGKEYWLRSKWNRIQVIVVIVIALNTLICLVSIGASGGTRVAVPQLSRSLRPLLIIYKLKNARRILFSLVHSVPKILNIAVILLLQLILFSVLATLMFSGVSGLEEGQCRFGRGPHHLDANDTDYCSTYSRNCTGGQVLYSCVWPDSLRRMLRIDNRHLLGQTISRRCGIPFGTYLFFSLQRIFPISCCRYVAEDICMPRCQDTLSLVQVLSCSELSFIFFAIFIVLGIYVFLSMVLAVVYNHYTVSGLRTFELLPNLCSLSRICMLELQTTVGGYQISE